MATHRAEEILEEYLSQLANFEDLLKVQESNHSRFGVWLHNVGLRLRKLENYFAGTMLPQHAEQFYTICEHDLALQARSEQLRAHDKHLEMQLRSLRKQIGRVARWNQPHPEDLQQLSRQGLEVARELREHELEITKWFDQSLLRSYPSSA